MTSKIGLWAMMASSLIACAAFAAEPEMLGNVTPVHDPAIIKAGDTYYVFSTGQAADATGVIPIRSSKDLVNWTLSGKVFDAIPSWATEQIRGVKGLWAPDISQIGATYRLYYSASTFGSNRSAIGLATATTLDPTAPGYGWKDQGIVVSSDRKDDYNAIDPALFVDTDGSQWMVFGSFWTGIKLVRIDPATGKASTTDPAVHALARRGRPDAIEAPYLVHRGDYYYLFASFDFCCKGAASTYYTAVGRSKAVTGPYVDYVGKPMLDGFAQIVLHGDLDKTKRWKGPGGGTVLHDGDKWYIVHHAYDAQNKGIPTLQVTPIGWTADGWPAPR
ncbi:arabinan endo-1,5-alpha-L-arabinosidase (plasmid) [Polymorphobacter sp. PAMC 29334]|uniref:arabinan endo-1,5-alpha-L-arabinosidase n=1 Tax=Polymorphobacter sp. PAMC 29334 TaxID=2862331 RepID=UPI001C664995|nr:arabinan endo-1,5-alpha-L-arabinosidase [Polymorphobacter sp. PAMC 29334]QYE32995.1 arabinan endo-1,5-alpha-L-arabinosidase [Polymorphobacter sp. PAMC 29334]